MERPQHLSSFNPIAILVVILFHLVGLIGLLIPSLQHLFLLLVPFHLGLMMVILMLTHRPLNDHFIVFILTVITLSSLAEWVGIHTSLLFGHYAYGNTLGFKLNGVPLIIGINWFLLIYSTGVTMQRSPIKSKWLRLLTGAAILVLLDLLIEPVAIRFNYWHWAGSIVPISAGFYSAQYCCWYLNNLTLPGKAALVLRYWLVNLYFLVCCWLVRLFSWVYLIQIFDLTPSTIYFRCFFYNIKLALIIIVLYCRYFFNTKSFF
jgi:putative membrane protein